jgi:chlorobactene glucosyltransferase
MLLIALSNALTFPRLRPDNQAEEMKVSILIPARNEAQRIGETLPKLLDQVYPAMEVILLDDCSEDETASIAIEAAKGDPRFRLIEGRELPSGWLGKNWACHQLAGQAQGEILVFTDADVLWQPQGLGAVLGLLRDGSADLLTIWPTQKTETRAERLVVPLMMFALLAYLPEMLVRFFPLPAFAAANGQCMVFRRELYDAIEGHRAVRDKIVEDVQLARLVKRNGARLIMGLGHGLIQTRMYSGWQAVRQGFGKNILAGYGGQPLLLLGATFLHLLIFVAPWIMLVLGLLLPIDDQVIILSAGASLLGIFVRGITALTSGARLKDAFGMPISVTLMTLIALQALHWHFLPSGPQWKGRSLRENER